MGDRGRQYQGSREGNERGQSLSRSGDRAESSYTRGLQEVPPQPESIVQHFWMREEEPSFCDIEDTLKGLKVEQIEELISGYSINDLKRAGNEVLTFPWEPSNAKEHNYEGGVSIFKDFVSKHEPYNSGLIPQSRKESNFSLVQNLKALELTSKPCNPHSLKDFAVEKNRDKLGQDLYDMLHCNQETAQMTALGILERITQAKWEAHYAKWKPYYDDFEGIS